MKRVVIATLIGLMALAACAVAEASEVELLVNKLVEKGVLTPLEAQILLDETRTKVASDIADRKHDTLPKWIQTFKLKGDLRLRYQLVKLDDTQDAHEARYRLRLGFESYMNDNFSIHGGFASGGDDPRSTNETWDDIFETKDARIDYAYVQWKPQPYMTWKAGKIKGMLKGVVWNPTDLLWDSDINPEGIVWQVYYPNFFPEVGDVDVFNTLGWFMLDESTADGSDPMLILNQAGVKMTHNDVYAKAAATGYWFIHEQGESFAEHSSGTNTLEMGGLGRRYHYDSIAFSAELGGLLPFDQAWMPFGAVFGDYIINPDPDGDNDGVAVGGKIGHAKVKKPNTWQFKGLYRYLQTDAWLDTFPDSDFHNSTGGATNAHGPEFVFKYALWKNVILALDYYYTEMINSPHNAEHVLQCDLLWKF